MHAVAEILVNNLSHLFAFGKVPLCMKIIQMVFVEYRLFASVGLDKLLYLMLLHSRRM